MSTSHGEIDVIPGEHVFFRAIRSTLLTASFLPLSHHGMLSESAESRTGTVFREVRRLDGRARLSLSTTVSHFTRTPQPALHIKNPWLFGDCISHVLHRPLPSSTGSIGLAFHAFSHILSHLKHSRSQRSRVSHVVLPTHHQDACCTEEVNEGQV